MARAAGGSMARSPPAVGKVRAKRLRYYPRDWWFLINELPVAVRGGGKNAD